MIAIMSYSNNAIPEQTCLAGKRSWTRKRNFQLSKLQNGDLYEIPGFQGSQRSLNKLVLVEIENPCANAYRQAFCALLDNS
jgi:hypothetical protein